MAQSLDPTTESAIRGSRDSSGMVLIWDIPGKAWRRVYPVDAREMIRGGTGTLTPPDDVEPPAAPAKFTAPKHASTAATGESAIDFSNFSDDQLQRFAMTARVDTSGMARAQVIEALDEAGFTPQEGPAGAQTSTQAAATPATHSADGGKDKGGKGGKSK